MDYSDSLVLTLWKNPNEQLVQIEKEIEYPQIEEKRIFLEDYKQALIEFLDIFESSSFLKERNDHIHITEDDSESLACELFREYSLWNNETETYQIDLQFECSRIDTYISNLYGLSALQPQMDKFMNLFSTANSNEELINDCIAHSSLSRSLVLFVLSLSLSEFKEVNQQSINNEIEKIGAISDFVFRIEYGTWDLRTDEDV